MPVLNDAAVLRQFRAVLANWKFTGYVTGKDVVLEWIKDNLTNVTLKDVAHAMNEHLQHGGGIDQVPETRPEWSAWSFHYDFRVLVANRLLYVEAILQDDDPTDPTIHVVSIHDV
jgi:hypothetical protein